VADLVTLTERPGLALATIMARQGVDAAAVGAALGLAAPIRPERRAGGGLELVATGPGQWLAVADAPASPWPEVLESRLGGLASVSDQSGAYVVWRIAGPGARALCQRGVAIDLHPDAFPPGAAATTVIAHLGVVLWRLEDPNAPETFEVAVFRSYAQSFRHWFEITARSLDPQRI